MTRTTPELAERALDPARSVVVAACAGSGKTWLLVSRILRLLLAGVAPGEILAITFTRYAAQEMAARLREWLQFLATAGEADVRRFLKERCVPEHELDSAAARGRMLYEDVLNAYPGVTLSTFHSWYLQLLRCAPLSAGALGNLTLSEQSAALIDEAWDLFAEECRRSPDSAAALGLDRLLGDYGRENTQRLLVSLLHHRSDWWAYVGQADDGVARALGELEAGLGVDRETDLVATTMRDELSRARIRQFADLLRCSTATDQERAAAIEAALEGADAAGLAEAVSRAVLTSEGRLRARKPTTAQAKRLGVEREAALIELHEALGARMVELKDRIVDQRSLHMHAAAYAAGVRLIALYQQLKLDRQIVDFADVEWMAFDLLKRSDQAITLQFKLDSRYRHILLDEFQDTNPLQWLALESWFEAAAEADTSPTVFLVGDPKQAIYRFRRAEAKLFDAAREWLVEHQSAQVLAQDESRRCAQPVLDIVNRVFAAEPAYAADFNAHAAHRLGLPGRVEVLPLVRHEVGAVSVMPADALVRDPLSAPLLEEEDLRRESEARQLVEKVRQIVGRWRLAPRDDGADARLATYADIMILVRRRTHLQVYEQALRRAGIPFLTSRQGGLLDALEIRDLVALLEFLVSPFDDLKLANALRSPIFSCTDDDLLAIAGMPEGTWWERLQAMPGLASASTLGRARGLLLLWLDRADRLPVHDHLDKIYFEGDIERRYAAAVPASVRDAVVANLHAFIERALAVDAGRYPSLPRFLDELRDMRDAPADEAPDEGGVDVGSDAIRILTVHGAKGLEAPIVWLLDTAASRRAGEGYGVWVDWRPGDAAPLSVTLRTRKDELNRLQRDRLDQELRNEEREELNLLYVAMTRAKQVLIVSGCESRQEGKGNSWYGRLRAGVLAASGTEGADPVACATYGDVFDDEGQGAEPSPASVHYEAPSNLPTATPAGRRRDVAATPGQTYGTAFHLVMERLANCPEADPETLVGGLGLGAADARRCVEQARALFAAPHLQRFFIPGTFVRAFNELPIINELGELRRLDRVVEFGDEVWVLDYKTGQPGEAATDAVLAAQYREQVLGYCRSLAEVYPGRRIRGALVFSAGQWIEVAE